MIGTGIPLALLEPNLNKVVSLAMKFAPKKKKSYFSPDDYPVREPEIFPVSNVPNEPEIFPISDYPQEQEVFPVSSADQGPEILPVSNAEQPQEIFPVSERDTEPWTTYVGAKPGEEGAFDPLFDPGKTRREISDEG